MSKNKTVLLTLEEEESYHLIAVHCSREAFQVAFFLNKALGLKFKRNRKDIDFKHEQHMAFYPIFHCSDEANYVDYYLVANKFDAASAQLRPSGPLFAETEVVTTHLLPEFKNVDYFLKIEDEAAMIDPQAIIDDLNKIPQIITAYDVEVESIKSKENLIFN